MSEQSLAKQSYPGWEYPQQAHSPPAFWPYREEGFPAFPAGDDMRRFYNILAKTGHPMPEDEEELRSNRKVFITIFNELFNRTGGLLVFETLGRPVNEWNTLNAKTGGYLVLGLPDTPPTEAQIKIIADLVDLKVEDMVHIYAER